jgi:RimJ/RimL family protein N-acetyltransferase
MITVRDACDVIERMHTTRLRLEPMTLDHIDLLVLLDSDPEVTRYINGGQPTPREQVVGTIRRSLGHRWVALSIEDRGFLGWFALDPSGDDEYELGYRLPRHAWGRGLATEGSVALVQAAFTELGARRVWAQTMTVNARSRRVLEACGLKYVRTVSAAWDKPIEGTDLGDVEYLLLRADYRQGLPRRD